MSYRDQDWANAVRMAMAADPDFVQKIKARDAAENGLPSYTVRDAAFTARMYDAAEEEGFSWNPTPPSALELPEAQLERIAGLIVEEGKYPGSPWRPIMQAVKFAVSTPEEGSGPVLLNLLVELVHSASRDLVERRDYDRNRACSNWLVTRLMEMTEPKRERV